MRLLTRDYIEHEFFFQHVLRFVFIVQLLVRKLFLISKSVDAMIVVWIESLLTSSKIMGIVQKKSFFNKEFNITKINHERLEYSTFTDVLDSRCL